ncbi:MAG: hypothetical protein JXJ04_26285 [Spirochaetales bacterium]|nr:hypothetical protein [Spirochaetales bacterium]
MKRFVIFFIIPIFLINCVSTNTNNSEPASTNELSDLHQALEGIDNWDLSFVYDNITIETKILDEGKEEKTIKDFGQSSLDLQLIDGIYYLLDNAGINITKYNDTSEGKIKLHPVAFIYSGGVYYIIDIYIYKNDELIYRKQIHKIFSVSINGTDKVAKACVDIILPLLKS